MRYIPGSHLSETVHEIKPNQDNLLPMAQNATGVAEDTAVDAVLEPGQVVFHHEGVVHGSGPNNAGHPGVGLSIHYVTPHVRETRFEGSTAMLLRGEDRFGHWGSDPEPWEDFDPVCIQAMRDTRALYLNATQSKIDWGWAELGPIHSHFSHARTGVAVIRVPCLRQIHGSWPVDD